MSDELEQMPVEETPVETEAPAPEPAAEPVSMEDTLRDTYAKIKARNEEQPVEEAPKADRARDEQGRFAKQQQEQAQQAAQTQQPTQQPAERPTDINVAPNSWSAQGKALWNALPAAARAEIAKREADFHKGIEQYKGAAQFGQTIAKALEPYQQNIQASGYQAPDAIRYLLNVDHVMRHGSMEQKRDMLVRIGRSYQVSFDDSQPQPAGQPPAPRDPFNGQDPTAIIDQRVQQVIAQQEAQRRAQEAHAEIERFAATKDKYGMMSDWQTQPDGTQTSQFRQFMASAFNTGLATNIDEAYEVAARAHPASFAKLTAAQQAEAEKVRKDAAAQRVANARKASAPNVPMKGRAAEPGGPKRTMDETIRETARKLGVIH